MIFGGPWLVLRLFSPGFCLPSDHNGSSACVAPGALENGGEDHLLDPGTVGDLLMGCHSATYEDQVYINNYKI